jgi:hypothetical protein
LGIGVDQDARTVTSLLGGHGKMRREGGFPRPAFLTCENDGFQFSCFLSFWLSLIKEIMKSAFLAMKHTRRINTDQEFSKGK